MKTRITEVLGIKYPVLLSGMSWISTPKMVAAVSNAGGLGILATGPLDPRETREAIRVATEDGDNEKGVLPVGQATGLIHDVPTVSELMERVIAEAREAQKRLAVMVE